MPKFVDKRSEELLKREFDNSLNTTPWFSLAGGGRNMGLLDGRLSLTLPENEQ